MNDAISPSTSSPQAVAGRSPLLLTAWLIVLLLTVPEIILRGFMQLDTPWMTPARIGLVVILFGLSFIVPFIRPLRGFTLIFLVIYGVEGWFFGAVVPQTQAYSAIFGGNVNLAFFGERLMRIAAVLVMIAVLLGSGFKRSDFYLAIGNLRATAEPGFIPRTPEPWTKLGRNYAMISIAILLFFMVPALQPSLSNFSIGLVVFAAVCAAMNAFAEEFLYRAALLPQVLPLFPKSNTIILVAAWFGLAHFFGVPNGITGVLITGIGGWFFAKAMVETRGMGWSWFLHFLADFAVYMIILLAGGF